MSNITFTPESKFRTVSLVPSEFYEFCEQPPTTQRRSSRRVDGSNGSGDTGRLSGLSFPDWAGTSSYPEAQRLAVRGWPEGTAFARKLADKLSAELVTGLKRPEITFDVTGDMFDMGRVIEDVPESWMQWQDGQEEGGKPVHIVYNCSASAGISTDIMAMRGAAMCALAIVLEAAGRPVKIEVVSGISGAAPGGLFLEPRVIVKDFYDPTQIDAIAYAMIHPAFFRRHIFSAMEVMGVQDWGYGMPADCRGPKGDIYLGKAMYGDEQWESQASCERWVREQLELQGVQFTGQQEGR